MENTAEDKVTALLLLFENERVDRRYFGVFFCYSFRETKEDKNYDFFFV